MAVIGGHSINDREIKAGFAVTGLCAADRVFSNAGLRPGDRLILTKPLGTGILAFAAQIGRAPAGSLEAAAQSMASLNKTAAELMIEAGAHACTDVTGFGLMGHLAAMAVGQRNGRGNRLGRSAGPAGRVAVSCRRDRAGCL